jgi:hypothetical protein
LFYEISTDKFEGMENPMSHQTTSSEGKLSGNNISGTSEFESPLTGFRKGSEADDRPSTATTVPGWGRSKGIIVAFDFEGN